MVKGIGKAFLVAAAVMALVLPGTVMAKGKGGNAGMGTGSQIRTMNNTRSMDQTRTQQRLQDGSGVGVTGTSSGTLNRSGKTYGPGDGTGNMGVGPQDGTGFGAPGNR